MSEYGYMHSCFIKHVTNPNNYKKCYRKAYIAYVCVPKVGTIIINKPYNPFTGNTRGAGDARYAAISANMGVSQSDKYFLVPGTAAYSVAQNKGWLNTLGQYEVTTSEFPVVVCEPLGDMHVRSLEWLHAHCYQENRPFTFESFSCKYINSKTGEPPVYGWEEVTVKPTVQEAYLACFVPSIHQGVLNEVPVFRAMTNRADNVTPIIVNSTLTPELMGKGDFILFPMTADGKPDFNYDIPRLMHGTEFAITMKNVGWTEFLDPRAMKDEGYRRSLIGQLPSVNGRGSASVSNDALVEVGRYHSLFSSEKYRKYIDDLVLSVRHYCCNQEKNDAEKRNVAKKYLADWLAMSTTVSEGYSLFSFVEAYRNCSTNSTMSEETKITVNRYVTEVLSQLLIDILSCFTALTLTIDSLDFYMYLLSFITKENKLDSAVKGIDRYLACLSSYLSSVETPKGYGVMPETVESKVGEVLQSRCQYGVGAEVFDIVLFTDSKHENMTLSLYNARKKTDVLASVVVPLTKVQKRCMHLEYLTIAYQMMYKFLPVIVSVINRKVPGRETLSTPDVRIVDAVMAAFKYICYVPTIKEIKRKSGNEVEISAVPDKEVYELKKPVSDIDVKANVTGNILSVTVKGKRADADAANVFSRYLNISKATDQREIAAIALSLILLNMNMARVNGVAMKLAGYSEKQLTERLDVLRWRMRLEERYPKPIVLSNIKALENGDMEFNCTLFDMEIAKEVDLRCHLSFNLTLAEEAEKARPVSGDVNIPAMVKNIKERINWTVKERYSTDFLTLTTITATVYDRNDVLLADKQQVEVERNNLSAFLDFLAKMFVEAANLLRS